MSFQPEEPLSDKVGADLAVATLFSDTDSATLSDQIYAALREGLMIGEWLPGAKITARNVAKQYSTSLSPARDAMTRLANEGGLLLSETRMYSVPVLTADDYCEVMNVRLALEPMAAELSAALMGDDDVSELERINEAMRALIEQDKLREGLVLDSRFHLKLYMHCGSSVLWQVINNLWLRIGPTRNMLSKSYRKGLGGYENHKAIVQALRKNDPALSSKLIQRDLKQGARKLEIALREQHGVVV